MLQQFCILHHISIISYSYCQFITVSSLLSYVFISNFITSVSGSFFLKALFGYQKGLLRLKPAIKSSLISIISYSCRGQTPISHFHFTLEKRFLRSPMCLFPDRAELHLCCRQNKHCSLQYPPVCSPNAAM